MSMIKHWWARNRRVNLQAGLTCLSVTHPRSSFLQLTFTKLLLRLISGASLTASLVFHVQFFFIPPLPQYSHSFVLCISPSPLSTALLYSLGSLWLLQGSVCLVSVLSLISLPDSFFEPSSHHETALLKNHPWFLLYSTIKPQQSFKLLPDG